MVDGIGVFFGPIKLYVQFRYAVAIVFEFDI